MQTYPLFTLKKRPSIFAAGVAEKHLQVAMRDVPGLDGASSPQAQRQLAVEVEWPVHGQGTFSKAVSAVRTHFVASSDPSPHLQESSNCTGAEKLFFALDFFFLRLSAIRKSRKQFTCCFQPPSRKCNRPSREHTVAMPLFILTETSAGYVRPSQLRGSIAFARSALLVVQAPRSPN